MLPRVRGRCFPSWPPSLTSHPTAPHFTHHLHSMMQCAAVAGCKANAFDAECKCTACTDTNKEVVNNACVVRELLGTWG